MAIMGSWRTIVSPSFPNMSRNDTKKLLTTTDQRSVIHICAAAFLAACRW
jgi:hypothetical protein